MSDDMTQAVLNTAKALYDRDRAAGNVNFSKGKVVTFEAITPVNAAYVHDATVVMGAKCDKHDHTGAVNFAANQILLEAQRKVHQAEQARIKFAADKKRALESTPEGRRVAEVNAAKPAANPNLSKKEADKVRLMGMLTKQQALTTRRGSDESQV